MQPPTRGREAGRLRLVLNRRWRGISAGSDAPPAEQACALPTCATVAVERDESRRLLEVRSAQIMTGNVAIGLARPRPPRLRPAPSRRACCEFRHKQTLRSTPPTIQFPFLQPGRGRPVAATPPGRPDTTAKRRSEIRRRRSPKRRRQANRSLDSLLEYWWALAGLNGHWRGVLRLSQIGEKRRPSCAIADTFGGATTTAAPAGITVAAEHDHRYAWTAKPDGRRRQTFPRRGIYQRIRGLVRRRAGTRNAKTVSATTRSAARPASTSTDRWPGRFPSLRFSTTRLPTSCASPRP